MPIVTQSAHIGIQKSETNSTHSTVNENIKKATRALYSLMRVGLHGENGIDPETLISLFMNLCTTYIILWTRNIITYRQDFEPIEHALQKGIEANIITLYKCS
jgi:hypothetical protein